MKNKKIGMMEFFIFSFVVPGVLIASLGSHFKSFERISLILILFLGIFYTVYSFLYKYNKVEGKLSIWYWIRR